MLTSKEQTTFNRRMAEIEEKFKDRPESFFEQFGAKAKIYSYLLTAAEHENVRLFMSQLGFLTAPLAAKFLRDVCKPEGYEAWATATIWGHCVTWGFEIGWAYEYSLPESERRPEADLPDKEKLNWESPLKDLPLWAPQDHMQGLSGLAR